MSGLGIRLYTDEDVDPRLARELRLRGYDVVSCHDVVVSRRGLDDTAQLRFAADNARAILSFNIRDFVALDRQWKSSGHEHHGIVLAENSTSLSDLIRRTRLHLDTVTPVYQHNLVLFLALTRP